MSLSKFEIMFFLRSQLNRCLVNQINNHINPIRSSRRASCFVNADRTPNDDPDNEFEQLIDDPLYDEFKSNFLFRNRNLERAYVIQPWIKWGPDKLWNTTAELMLGMNSSSMPLKQCQSVICENTCFKIIFYLQTKPPP